MLAACYHIQYAPQIGLSLLSFHTGEACVVHAMNLYQCGINQLCIQRKKGYRDNIKLKYHWDLGLTQAHIKKIFHKKHPLGLFFNTKSRTTNIGPRVLDTPPEARSAEGNIGAYIPLGHR